MFDFHQENVYKGRNLVGGSVRRGGGGNFIFFSSSYFKVFSCCVGWFLQIVTNRISFSARHLKFHTELRIRRGYHLFEPDFSISPKKAQFWPKN